MVAYFRQKEPSGSKSTVRSLMARANAHVSSYLFADLKGFVCCRLLYHPDPESGVYYFCAETGESRWDKPGGEKKQKEYPTITDENGVTWQEINDDAQSGVYFYNPETGESVWQRPVAAESAAEPAGAAGSTGAAGAGETAGAGPEPIFL